jgi:uncharacterized protein (DUF2249 family)
MKPSACEITVDVCGLEPPEPLERVLGALTTLGRDRYLRMVIDREPLPLYRILAQNGFHYSVDALAHGLHEICIWQKP